MLRIAVPVVVAEIGWIAMGVVDVMMVGRIDAESIGAVSVGRAAFMLVAIAGIGLLLGLDTIIAQAYGAGDMRGCHLGLLHGTYLSLIMTVPLMLGGYAMAAGLHLWSMDPRVLALAVPYLKVVTWSALPIFLYATFRRYLQAINLVRPIMIALLSANLVNVAANWVLIFGNLGAPALGAVGAAWATVGGYVVMAGGMYLFNQRLYPIPFAWGRVARLAVLVGVLVAVNGVLFAEPTMRNLVLKIGVLVAAVPLLFFSGVLDDEEKRRLRKRFLG